MSGRRWVCLDVGETIIDETRVWGIWADLLGIPWLTFMAAYGAAVERHGQQRDVFSVLGVPDWRHRWPEVEARYGTFRATDLYADALPCIGALREVGYRVAVIGNQPARRDAELRALGVQPDVMAMSEAMGVAKPDPVFFDRALELMGSPAAGDVAYVGDRLDNDVGPASRAGLRAVWLRRGPWGRIPEAAPAAAALVVDSLAELVVRAEEAWPRV